jgi:endonuclease/exonuclease/phosphatase family metal-dependent hydrolase
VANILDSLDVLLIQEHWLFGFELQKLDDIHPDFNSVSKSVDMMDPISSLQKPRGYAGTAILYKKSLSNSLILHPDGCHRIIAVTLKLQEMKLLLVNVYMPCRGPKLADTEYIEVTDQLEEILSKFSQNHIILIAGDWNSQPTSKPKTKRECALHDLINHWDLQIKETGHGPTFIHSNGTDSSLIDYFLIGSTHQHLLTKCSKVDNCPQNTSDHYPIVAHLLSPSPDSKKEGTLKDGKQASHVKIRWDKADLSRYITETEDYIRSRVIHPVNLYEIEQEIIDLQTILVDTANKVTPTPSKKAKQRKRNCGMMT